MPELTGRIVGIFWTIVAALTIAGAILVSIIRLMLPQIGEQRDTIAIWLSEITNRPVQKHNLRVYLRLSTVLTDSEITFRDDL